VSKSKRRQKRTSKRLLKRLEACETCSYLAAVSNLLEESGLLGAVAHCPSCERELLIPMSPVGVGQEVFEKALHTVAAYIKVPDKPPATHFRFTLNGEEIFADPGCDEGLEGLVLCNVKFECPEEDLAKLRMNK
jgi:transcription elongation factor Elf1